MFVIGSYVDVGDYWGIMHRVSLDVELGIRFQVSDQLVNPVGEQIWEFVGSEIRSRMFWSAV